MKLALALVVALVACSSSHRDAPAQPPRPVSEQQSPKDPELRLQLLALFEEDQAVRNVFAEKLRAGGKPADHNADVIAMDKKSSAVIAAAIAKHGWPGKSIVGVDGAHLAWILVQHADHDLALQKDALARMEPMIATGEVEPSEYAYLYDRIALAEHRLQRYGTQWNGTGPRPLEDPANVDARRKAVGLEPIAEYAKQMEALHLPRQPEPGSGSATP